MDIVKAFLDGFSNKIRQPHEGPEPRRSSREGDPPPEIIKEDPIQIDGRVMTADQFVGYVEGLDFPSPRPTRLFLHHTWRPTVESWHGRDTIMAMKAYYEKQLWKDEQGRVHEGWTAGPHLFVAEDGIWLFSDLRWDGVGVAGHNTRTRHLEMVGDYDNALPGGATLQNTIAALGILHERLGLNVRNLNFHRDFSSKTCPGRAVTKEWIIPQIEAWVADYRRQHSGGPDDTSTLRENLKQMAQRLLVPMNPQTALARGAAARGLLGALTDEAPMEINDRAYIVQFFAEVLLVPVNEWDKVQSLRQFESSRDAAGEMAVGCDGEVHPLVAAPRDLDGYGE